MNKVITSEQAAALIQDNWTVGIGGFGSHCSPDDLLQSLADTYKHTGHPCSLTTVTGISTGTFRTDYVQGLSRIAIPGLLRGCIAGHFGNCPEIAELIAEDEIEGYALPLGVVIHLIRAIAGHKPGVLTQVGLNTYADPRNEACKANEKARNSGRNIVEILNLHGEEYLFYPSFSVDACMIRGTYADEEGNISVEHESLTDLGLQLAGAVKASGGIVIVQVEKIVKKGSIHPRKIRIPGDLVDFVVKARSEYHLQCYADTVMKPELCGDIQIPEESVPVMPLNIRKVIARRAVMELKPGYMINLGVGMPSGVGNVANEEGIAGSLTMTLESGQIGGVPVEGLGFGSAVNPKAILPLSDIFDLYDGGFLNITCLGAAEIDRNGNVNVSRFGKRATGPGGFINISQNTQNVIFMGSFTNGKSDIRIEEEKLKIINDGTGIKFVEKVQQITFSADYARKHGQNILYVTERAVFCLSEIGIKLIEIAPGADLKEDILGKMAFQPEIAENLRYMDSRIFALGKMGL